MLKDFEKYLTWNKKAKYDQTIFARYRSACVLRGGARAYQVLGAGLQKFTR
jgi:hypothetical protein